VSNHSQMMTAATASGQRPDLKIFWNLGTEVRHIGYRQISTETRKVVVRKLGYTNIT